MTTIIIKSDMHKPEDKILQDSGYMWIRGVWSKKIEMPQIRNEIEKLQLLKIPNIEIILD
jgi:hypothetical protein